MKTCKKCRVEIIDNTNICPLCNNIIHIQNTDKNHSLNTYPKIIDSISKYNLVTKIIVLVSIITAISCIILNVILRGVPWSILIILGIIYLWITIPYSIKKNITIASKLLAHTITALLVSFIIYYIFSVNNWHILDFTIPIILTIANIALIVLQIIQSIHQENYFIYQVVISILSIIPVVILNMNLMEILLPTYICIGVATISLISTIVFYSKDFITELKKRFHF